MADHADDPEWQAGYIEQLGEECLAELVDRATDPVTYRGQAVSDQQRGYLGAIGNALGEAYENGTLSGEAFGRLLTTWAESHGVEIPPQIADLVANASSPELREAFVEHPIAKWRDVGDDAAPLPLQPPMSWIIPIHGTRSMRRPMASARMSFIRTRLRSRTPSRPSSRAASTTWSASARRT